MFRVMIERLDALEADVSGEPKELPGCFFRTRLAAEAYAEKWRDDTHNTWVVTSPPGNRGLFEIKVRCLNSCSDPKHTYSVFPETNDPQYVFALAKDMCDDTHNAWIEMRKVVSEEEISEWPK